MRKESPKAQITGSAVAEGADLGDLFDSKDAAVNARSYKWRIPVCA